MLILRKILIDDLEMIMNWRMKPEITQFMYTDPNLSMEKQIAWYDNIVNNNRNYIRIIQYDGKDIGLYSITDIVKDMNCFWAYYIADLSFQGKGIGTTIECNNYDYAFDILKVHKVSCEVLSFNERVVNIHKKFGSKVEGVLKEHIKKNNNYLDIVRMAILKNEWYQIRQNYKYDKCMFE